MGSDERRRAELVPVGRGGLILASPLILVVLAEVWPNGDTRCSVARRYKNRRNRGASISRLDEKSDDLSICAIF